MPKREISAFFHSYAHDFNAIYGTKDTLANNLVNRLFRKSMRLRYIRSIEGCCPIEGRTVIDVGCGPGQYGIVLAGMGAGGVLGMDFAENMIGLAGRNAQAAGVADRCRFVLADFLDYRFDGSYDYAIVMGFMDYIEDPGRCIEKVLSITKRKAFFSFPASSGLLAMQRRIRYRKRCDLFMYGRKDIDLLFSSVPCRRFEIEKISRDYFVTAFME